MGNVDSMRFLPQWTKRAMTELGGRDPLGLSRASERLTENLLMGITTQTSRARYYSFYCWALWHIHQTGKPTRWPDFLSAFRRREAVLAMSTLLDEGAKSPAGADEANAQLARAKATKDAYTEFKVLPSNDLGGYGQYYAGSLYHLRLTCTDDRLMHHIADGLAEEIAQALDETLSKSSYVSKKGYLETRIPWRMLSDSAEHFSLDAIRNPAAAREREVLTRLFLATDSRNTDDLLRRLSLGQILTIIKAYEKLGTPLTDDDDWETDIVFAPCYFGVLHVGEKKTKHYDPPKALQDCQAYWRQYCLHQYFTVAMECFLCAVLEVVGAEALGQTFDDVLDRLSGPEFQKHLRKLAGGNISSPQAFMATLGLREIPTEVISIENQKKYSWGHKLCEEELCRQMIPNLPPPEEAAALSCIMLSILYAKWRGRTEDQVFVEVSSKMKQDYWVSHTFDIIDAWITTATTWNEALRPLLRNLVVDRHDQVVYSKGRLDSSWLQWSGNRLTKEQDCRPYLRSSRQNNAIRIMIDLCLLRRNRKGEISLTPEGERQLESILGDQK